MSTRSQQFWELYCKEGPSAATSWLYVISQQLGYVKDTASTRMNWEYASPTWGPITITINTLKPEKDPRKIAAAAETKHIDSASVKDGTCENHDDCPFCTSGAGHHLRVALPLRNQTWFMHFSPYGYFNEHCIVASPYHEPMTITKQTFVDLLELVERFPTYFFGSNADLPIVGGSILAHNHYQGGHHSFPLDFAPSQSIGPLTIYPTVNLSLVHWPLSVIRLESTSKPELISASTHILAQWRSYSDKVLSIEPFSEKGAVQNTITPIARCIPSEHGPVYRLDLALRNNATSDAYPLGIFHPHEDVWAVKKENIGLIEVMGLAILPPRVKEKFAVESDNTARDQVGALFVKGLEDAGVFKQDENGQHALRRFVESL